MRRTTNRKSAKLNERKPSSYAKNRWPVWRKWMQLPKLTKELEQRPLEEQRHLEKEKRRKEEALQLEQEQMRLDEELSD